MPTTRTVTVSVHCRLCDDTHTARCTIAAGSPRTFSDPGEAATISVDDWTPTQCQDCWDRSYTLLMTENAENEAWDQVRDAETNGGQQFDTHAEREDFYR